MTSPWTSERSSGTASVAASGCTRAPPSQLAQPLGRLRRRHLAVQAGPNSGVVVDVHGRQVGVGRVPDRRRNLVAAQEGLEADLVPRPVLDQPARGRVAGLV